MNGSTTNNYSELFKTSYIAKPRDAFHIFHGAAILETGCGGARTRCAHPSAARTKALVR